MTCEEANESSLLSRGGTKRKAMGTEGEKDGMAPRKQAKQNKRTQLKSGDAFHRMNYLMQAAYAMKAQPSLARFYLRLVKGVASRSVLRLHSSAKDLICKKCHGLLVPGETSITRLHSTRHSHFRVDSCSFCGTSRRIGLSAQQRPANHVK